MRIPQKADRLDWDYDGEADVLYVSIGKPRKATGVDIGQGVIVRYDEKRRQVVGLTIMGIRARLLELTPPARTGASRHGPDAGGERLDLAAARDDEAEPPGVARHAADWGRPSEPR